MPSDGSFASKACSGFVRLMSAKNLVAWILLAAAVAGTTRAGSPVAPPPSLDMPTKDYAAIVQDLSAAQFVVITYYDGTKSMVSKPEWLEPLKKLLAAADGQPDSYCFCRNYPTVTFVGKDRPLATMEVPHGEKLRVSGDRYSGDFTVDPKIARLVNDWLMLPHDQGRLPRKARPGQPIRSDLPNPLTGVLPSIPGAK